MDSVCSWSHTSGLGASTFGLSDGGGESDDGKEEGEEVVDLSALLAGVERVLDSDEEIDGVAQMETDGEQFQQHVDVVVVHAEVLLVHHHLHAQRQPLEHLSDVYQLLEPVKVIPHQNNVEVRHCLEQRYVGNQHRRVLAAFFPEVVQPRDAQRNCIVSGLPREEIIAVMMRAESSPGPKN